MVLGQAKKALDECESELKKLLESGARKGDYDAVEKLISLARHVRNLAETIPINNSNVTPADMPAISMHVRQDKKLPEYPRFIKRNNYLIKVGWSKSEKQEYEHKSPKNVLDMLVKILSERPVDGPLIQTSEIWPMHDSEDNTEIPKNQVYVALAWLKQLGLVQQHGRQGYQIPQAKKLSQTTKTAWESLAAG